MVKRRGGRRIHKKRQTFDRIEGPACEKCGKPNLICICDSLAEVATKTEVLILQHPQEKKEQLATAWLAHRCLPKSTFKIGLSWRNLGHALGKEVTPSEWGVLYLGTRVQNESRNLQTSTLLMADKDGNLQPVASKLKGIVVLDGSWREVKAMWWRNAWLLKLKRLVVKPPNPSIYGSLRREPRPDSISTIESLGYALSELEKRPELLAQLQAPLSALVDRIRNYSTTALIRERT